MIKDLMTPEQHEEFWRRMKSKSDDPNDKVTEEPATLEGFIVETAYSGTRGYKKYGTMLWEDCRKRLLRKEPRRAVWDSVSFLPVKRCEARLSEAIEAQRALEAFRNEQNH